MRVAVYYGNKDIRIEERAIPDIGPGEVLVKVLSSGICGSDVMEWYRIDRVPLVLGHEIAGEIVDVGKGVKKYKKGDRIACSHHVPCGECHYCKMGHPTVCDTLRKTNFDPGGFCEYLRLSPIHVEKGIYKLPGSVSDEEATFIEPLACVLRGQRLAGVKKGQTVLVIGSGISGLLHIQMAKVNGAKNVIATDLIGYRIDAALRFGAGTAINAAEYTPENLLEINNGCLADVVILCAGAPQAINQALGSVARGGTVLFFSAGNQGASVPLDINKVFWRTEAALISSYAASPGEHIEALGLIKERKINVKDMITHRLPLADIQKGFGYVVDGKESIKVIIEPCK